MAKLTRSGIAYDLTISPHKTEIMYGENRVTYVFSSELYMSKFEEKIESNRIKINESLTNRFNIEIDTDLLADIKLYTQIEKRGFLIKTEEESYRWQNIIRLDGLKMTIGN